MMDKQLKRAMMAAGVAMAFGFAPQAMAAAGVHFDPDGADATFGTSVVSTFDWDAGHVLYSDCFGKGGAGAASGCTIRAQGPISSVTGLASIPPGVTYTFTLEKKAISTFGASYDGATVVAPEGVTFNDFAGDPGFFRIYVDKTGVPHSDLLGTGYDNVSVVPEAKIILEGTVKVTTFGLTNNSITSEVFDQFGANNYPGLMTYSTSGSPKFSIEVTSIDSNYFKDPLTLFTLEFSPDANHTDNSNSPFDTINPAKSVVGTAFSKAIVGTDGVNDIYCGDKSDTAKCSAQFQGDAKTVFLTEVVPEPETLALLGIALAGLGFSMRRRSAAGSAA
jgi:hypothetical protein